MCLTGHYRAGGRGLLGKKGEESKVAIRSIRRDVMEQLKKDPDPQGTNFLSPSYLQEVAKRFLNDEHITLGKGQSILLNAFYGGNRYYAFIQTTSVW